MSEQQFHPNQIFIDTYPPEAAAFCNQSQSSEQPMYIKEIEPLDGHRRFMIDLTSNIPIKPKTNLDLILEYQGYLNSTDWYVTRYAETGVVIPQEVMSQRALARSKIDELREQL